MSVLLKRCGAPQFPSFVNTSVALRSCFCFVGVRCCAPRHRRDAASAAASARFDLAGAAGAFTSLRQWRSLPTVTQPGSCTGYFFRWFFRINACWRSASRYVPSCSKLSA